MICYNSSYNNTYGITIVECGNDTIVRVIVVILILMITIVILIILVFISLRGPRRRPPATTRRSPGLRQQITFIRHLYIF